VVSFDWATVRRIMLEDGYQETQVDDSVTSVSHLDQKLQPLIDAYVKNKSITEKFAIEGLTVTMIMEKFDCDFWVGLEFLDDFIDDPERAEMLKEFTLFN